MQQANNAEWKERCGAFTKIGELARQHRLIDPAEYNLVIDTLTTHCSDPNFRAQAAALQAAFWTFCARHGYDRHRIQVLNALIFVNMAPLYDRPLADYLYLLGRHRLAEALAGPDTER